MGERPDAIVVLKVSELRKIVAEEVAAVVRAHSGAPVMDETETAALLGVSKVTLRRYVDQHGLPAHALSAKERRFLRAEVMAWIETQRSEVA